MICPNFTVPVGFSTVIASVCFTSGCLAAVENTICLFVVHRLHSLRKTARFFMASLAASELFSGVAANFHISLKLMLHSSLDSVILWKFESALWYFTTSVVTLNLVNVSLDRYIAITSPLHYHIKMSLKRCVALILFSWIFSILAASLASIVPLIDLPKLWICGTVTAVLIPFCIISFCYFKIYNATRRTFPERENITDAQQIAENKRQAKTARTFVIITVLFLILFAPSFIFHCIQLFSTSLYRGKGMEQLCTQLDSNRTVWICIAVASYFSAVCDPWVYAIRMPEFRVALKELFHCSRRRARSKKLVRMAETAKKKKKMQVSEVHAGGVKQGGYVKSTT